MNIVKDFLFKTTIIIGLFLLLFLNTNRSDAQVIKRVDPKTEMFTDTLTGFQFEDGVEVCKTANNSLYEPRISKKGNYYRHYCPIINSKTLDKSIYYDYYVAIFGNDQAEKLYADKLNKKKQ